MKTIRTTSEIKEVVREAKVNGKSVHLVPTMGYFHEGHIMLIRSARKKCDILIVSIFVNPAQFGANEDYEHYPRDLTRDEKIAEKEKVNFIFAPNVSEMYPTDCSTFVEVESLSRIMCGESRPIHFRGVTTVVAKLFNLIQPDAAYFGQKDAQQSVIIKKMVSDLNMGVKIKVLPTVREKDGLAMSSRNEYLNKEERKAAVILYRALLKAKDEIAKGQKNAGKLRKEITEMIKGEKLARIDYIAVVDPENLNETAVIDKPVLIAIAVWFGKTRLIDNIIVRKHSLK